LAVIDINADNWPDIIVANNDSNNIGIFLSTDNGTFISQMTYSAGSGPWNAIVVDVNNDQTLDIMIANCGSYSICVFLCFGYEGNTNKIIN
jgi:hypothetical protein